MPVNCMIDSAYLTGMELYLPTGTPTVIDTPVFKKTHQPTQPAQIDTPGPATTQAFTYTPPPGETPNPIQVTLPSLPP